MALPNQSDVSDYYRSLVTGQTKLQTNSCCVSAKSTEEKDILAKIHEEVTSKFYGCGSPIPVCIKGATILDLGCGTGRDVFLCSALVGPTGHVIGVDMTDESLEIGRKYIEYHTNAFGLPHPNVDLRKGMIEDLKGAAVEDNTVDVVISNCVVNLTPDKEPVLREVFRVLKPGGELYFSDVYSDRRIPEELRKDKLAWGECLSGALYEQDFQRLMRKVGFRDIREVTRRPITVANDELKERLAPIQFASVTFRAFKIDSLEDAYEDYGQKAEFVGPCDRVGDLFTLDKQNIFKKGYTYPIDGNTADMLTKTRFAAFFKVSARGPHRGLFILPSPVTIRDTLDMGEEQSSPCASCPNRAPGGGIPPCTGRGMCPGGVPPCAGRGMCPGGSAPPCAGRGMCPGGSAPPCAGRGMCPGQK